MAQALVKYETIDQKQIADLLAGKEPRPPEDWSDSGSGKPAVADAGDADADEKASGVGGPAELH